jgi:hypothetical protein
MKGLLYGEGVLGNVFASTGCNIVVVYKHNGELLDVQVIPLADIKIFD